MVTNNEQYSVTKLEAAKRQLDTAIKLYFDHADSLSVHTLAYASFKILYDLYPSLKSDGYSAEVDKLIRQPAIGWSRFSRTANFLKHANRDPVGELEDHSEEHVEATIGLALCLYRQITGDLTSRMRGFHCWTKAIHPEAFNSPPSPELDIAAQEDEAIRIIRALPLAERLAMGKMVAEAIAQVWAMQKNGLIESNERVDEVV